jgi:PIN domain nuclease of toxin-antitoxin system
LILLDTHALLWWALDPAQLAAKAGAVLEEIEKRGGFASAISIWELGVKIQRGKLEMGLGIEELPAALNRARPWNWFRWIPRSGSEAWPCPGDTATRPIVSSSQRHSSKAFRF